MLNFSIAKRAKRSKHNNFDRPYHRSCTRHSTHPPRPMSATHIDQEMDDEDNTVHQQSTSSSITNNSGELSEANHRMDDDDDIQDIQSLSTINFTHSKKRRLSLLNNRPQQQSIYPSTSQPNLLSIRENLQKGRNSIEIKHEIIEFI